MDIFIKVCQFIVSFSLLVLIHELGHFMFARMFGIRVEKFYLFFDPWVSLFKFNYKGTEYGIGWLPFGGYCKIAGMVDESMDTEALKQEPKPDEFRSKPAWQRLLVMVGGVLMNIVLATLIYIGSAYTWGEEYLANDEMTAGSVFSELGHQIGFQDGDRIVSVGGERFEDYHNMVKALILDAGEPIEVLRDEQTLTLTIGEEYVSQLLRSKDFIFPRMEFVAGKVSRHEGAGEAGIREGDRLVALDTVSMIYFDQWVKAMEARPGQTVQITVNRGGELLTMAVQVNAEGKIGIAPDAAKVLPMHAHKYSLLASVPAGFRRAGSEISSYWKQLRMIFSPKTEAYKSVGGVITIGNIFPSYWDWQIFWNVTAFISIVLAIMNLIPLPGLDGGHVMFLLYEVVTRRKPSDRFLETATTIGLLILLAVLVLANGNDIYRFFIK